MLEHKRFEMEFAGRKLSAEFGKLANQVNASCVVTYGDTVILATAVIGKEPRQGMDFFPLQIEVREKMYAAGRIKGSRFVKREGRPTDYAVLTGRMIDRGIRPLFNQEIRNEVQLVSTALAYDEENSFGVLSITAASLALHISDIPWNGPLVGISVGRINGEFVVNPTMTQQAESDLNLVLSISGEGKVVMVDADGSEVLEEDMSAAFEFAISAAKPLIEFVKKIRTEIGVEKKDEQALVAASIAESEVSLEDKKAKFEEAKIFFAPQLDKYLFNQPVGTKRERKAVAKVLLNEFVEKLIAEEAHEEIISYIKDNFETYLEEEVTKAILDRDLRVDGRSLTDVRALSSEVSALPRMHGTGLFSRGETQVLSIVTLGAPSDALISDEMTENDTKKYYMHHYNSPPYSFGEPGRFMGAGRREIGHGALAEKALLPVLPDRAKFPYTILVVSEVMGSNGSSSMGSTCGSTLALMDAGVPIKKPVAGVAMGLASIGENYKVLTDLQDLEDGEGGMDFKVTGTRDGITSIQMDTKTNGLSMEICRQAISQAREARIKIIENIETAIAEPRSSLSEYAPKITTLQIEPSKIGAVIGSGGKTINEIIDTCGVQIDIEDDGLVTITGVGEEGSDKAKDWIEKLTKDIEPGELYDGKVVRLMDFGAFVELLPGRDGMVHISEFSNERVNKIEDVAKMGQELKVKVLEVDPSGKIKLSVKQADPNYKPQPRDSYSGGGHSRGSGGFRK
jgi:polyribonucleotide nucleotidyltransferase